MIWSESLEETLSRNFVETLLEFSQIINNFDYPFDN